MRPVGLPPALLLTAALLLPSSVLPASPPEDGAVTVIGTGTLRRCTLVARGRLERVSSLPYGVEMGTVKVEEVLWTDGTSGRTETAQILSSEAGYFSRVKEEALWFLRRLEGRARFECAGIVDLSGVDGPARLAAVRRSLEIESLPANQRAEALRVACYEALGAPDSWTRRNAGRELAHLASLRPSAFTAADLEDVTDRALREEDRLLRPLLVEAAESLSLAGSRGLLAKGTETRVSLAGAPAFRALREEKDPAKRAAALPGVGAEPGAAADAALAAALREDPAPSVRSGAAEAMAGRPRTGAATEALVAALGGDGDPAVRAAAAEALGRLRAAEGIPALRAACPGGGPLSRAALFALARIGSPAAEEALREFRRTVAGDGPGEAETRDLVDFLLTEDFRKQEETLRRMREGR